MKDWSFKVDYTMKILHFFNEDSWGMGKRMKQQELKILVKDYYCVHFFVTNIIWAQNRQHCHYKVVFSV